MTRLFTLLLFMFTVAAHAEEVPRVLVTIKPVHSLLSQLLQGVTEPELLLDGYQSPHTFQLRPSGARKLAQADVIIWVGPTLESSLHKPLRQLTNKVVIQLVHADHDHDVGHLHIDPHRWLDPFLAIEDIHQVSEILIQHYPQLKQTLERNRDKLTLQLRQLDMEIKARFTDQRSVSAMLYHDAWHYFQERYGLSIHGIINANAHQQPGARHLHEIGEIIKNRKTKCLLIGPQFKPKYLGTLQAKHQLRIVTLDPLAAELPAGSGSYFQMMRDITDAFVQCH